MATNQFDQYSYSGYEPLPIDDIGRGLERRQLKHEQNLADMDQLDDAFGALKFLPQDDIRGKERLNQYRQQLDKFAKEGDYSQAKPFIRRVARAYANDLNSGYLGYTQQSYQNYLKDMDLIDKSDRPDYEKSLAKQMRFNQYKGIDPTGELFNQYYKTAPVPEYVDLMKEASTYLKDMKPNEIATTSGWFQTPDGLRWLKNDQKVENLPKEVLHEAGINVLKNNPKVLNSLAFSALVSGKDPNQYLSEAIGETANTLSDIYKRKNVAYDQSMQSTPEWQYGAGFNMDDANANYEAREYDENIYMPKYSELEGAKLKMSPGNKLMGSTPYISTGTDYADPKKLREQIGTETYDNLAEFYKGETDDETAFNIYNHLQSIKGKKFSVKVIPFPDNKIAREQTGLVERNIMHRKFYFPSTNETYTGKELLEKKSLRDKFDIKAKSAKDLTQELQLIGRFDVDNQFADATGDDIGFARPYSAKIGTQEIVVSMSDGEANSEQARKDYVINQLSKARRSMIPQSLDKLGIPDAKVLYDDASGVYTLKYKGFNGEFADVNDLGDAVIQLYKEK
jgi:hypothetical protein